MSANMERKFNVCPANAMTAKVMKNTIGTASPATKASITPITAKCTRMTIVTVIIPSRISCSKSSRIRSELSCIVFILRDEGIRQLALISSIFLFPRSTRSRIDPPDRFTTDN
jgi:hypothetical protein